MSTLLIGGCGYIGSYLYRELIESGYQVDVCDSLVRGLPDSMGTPVHQYSHSNIATSSIRNYETILWFAGKSSVQSAEQNPDAALVENCLLLAALRRRMNPDSRLIYASSASLYSIPPDSLAEPPWMSEEDQTCKAITAYDSSKSVMDAMTEGFFDNTVALRMGTLCGYSPNIRPELVFNAMCLSALKNRVIRVSNPTKWRSILFLQDLAEVVKKLIKADHTPRILNVASKTLTMENLAWHIARHFRAEIEELPPFFTYNFKMYTDKMLNMLDYNPSSVKLETHCQHFAESVKKAGLV